MPYWAMWKQEIAICVRNKLENFEEKMVVIYSDSLWHKIILNVSCY